jgi:transposase
MTVGGIFMASKGQKFNSYSQDLKQEILDKYYSGQCGERSLANEYNIPAGTIATWIHKTKLGVDVKINHRKGNTGRPKTDEDIDYKEKYEILKNYQAFLKAQREKK